VFQIVGTTCISGHGSKLPALFSKNVSADTWDGTTFCLISDKKGDNSSTLICDGKATKSLTPMVSFYK
jgi:hypothetical protein